MHSEQHLSVPDRYYTLKELLIRPGFHKAWGVSDGLPFDDTIENLSEAIDSPPLFIM